MVKYTYKIAAREDPAKNVAGILMPPKYPSASPQKFFNTGADVVDPPRISRIDDGERFNFEDLFV